MVQDTMTATLDERAPDTESVAQATQEDAAPAVDSKLNDPEIAKAFQSELDRRINQAQSKWERASRDRELAATEKARHEAAEQKLLDDGKLEEYAKGKEREADQAKKKLKEYEHRDKGNVLLDNKAISDPKLRSIFLAMNGDLENIAESIDGFLETYADTVEKQAASTVNERLGTEPPPKQGKPPTPKDVSDMTPEEWTAYKKANQIF